MNRLRRRRAAASGSSSSAARDPGVEASSTGSIRSVRSATAVACCSRCRSVGALRIPPPSCTARAAAAEIWNGMLWSTARGSIGCPAGSVSAGRRPLGAPVSGSGQRSVSRAYSAAPIPRMSSAAVASGMVAGNARGHIAVDADADAAGMVDGQRHPGGVRRFGRGGQRLHGAGAADRGREVSATSFSDPPGSISETTRPPAPALVTSSTRATPGLSSRLNLRVRSDLLHLPGRQRAAGIDEGHATWRSRAVSGPARTAARSGRRGTPAGGSGRPRCWPRQQVDVLLLGGLGGRLRRAQAGGGVGCGMLRVGGAAAAGSSSSRRPEDSTRVCPRGWSFTPGPFPDPTAGGAAWARTEALVAAVRTCCAQGT